MKRRLFLSVLLWLATIVWIHGESTYTFSISATPGGVFPVGVENLNNFKFGGGGSLAIDINPFNISFLSFKFDLGYNYIPIVTADGISLVNAAGGLGYRLKPLDWLMLEVYGLGGYYRAFLGGDNGGQGGGLFLSGGGQVQMDIMPSFSLGADLRYIYNHMLYQGLKISLGMTYTIPTEEQLRERQMGKEELFQVKPDLLSIEGIEFQKMFPVFFKYYDTNSIGKALITNISSEPVESISVSLFVEKYMSDPIECARIERLDPGEMREVELYALFDDAVLEITEGTKVTAKVIAQCNVEGEDRNVETVDTLEMYDRNAVTWDDDRKAAAFVTAKDPMILEFAKNMAAWTRGLTSGVMNRKLSQAIAVHNALKLYGLSYVIDPATPFSEFSLDEMAVDFLQFPRQTLTYSAGDCDDLTILYCSLLEALGIETAFVTVPGHIFMAFSLGITPRQARRDYLRPDEFIFIEDKAWVPIEITCVQDSFLDAWQEGAREWRESESKEQTGFFPIHEAWDIYQPVGLPGGNMDITLPNRDAVVAATSEEIGKLVNREIYPRVADLQKRINENNNNPRYINRLGVLYAKWGLIDEAKEQFWLVLDQQEYVPGLLNMGNILFLGREFESAQIYYDRAIIQAPENPHALLSVARTNHELENYGLVRHTYNKLKNIAPELAEQFDYLDLRGEEATRAAEAGGEDSLVIWIEE